MVLVPGTRTKTCPVESFMEPVIARIRWAEAAFSLSWSTVSAIGNLLVLLDIDRGLAGDQRVLREALAIVVPRPEEPAAHPRLRTGRWPQVVHPVVPGQVRAGLAGDGELPRELGN